MLNRLFPGVGFNGGWTLIDYQDTTPVTISSPKRAIVIAVVQDDTNSIRDRFVTWDVMYDENSMSCSWGHYFDKFEDAVEDYRQRLAKYLQDKEENREIKRRGMEDGSMAASWLVDGNTPDPIQALQRLVQGIEDGDPEILDELPQPRLGGEFADDPTWEDILKEELDEYSDDRLFNGEYDDLENSYHEGFTEGIEKELRHKLKAYSDPEHGFSRKV